MPRHELALRGGRSTPGVVRAGSTVRRPTPKNADFVFELLQHLEMRGFAGAPRILGEDEFGRQILTFIAGTVPRELGGFTRVQIRAAARLLRSLHDATANCPLKGREDIVCHGDASPCNCVFVDGMPVAFIDFDDAHAGPRQDDLGYAAWLWLDLGNEELNPEVQGGRMADFSLAYDHASARDLPEVVLAIQRKFSALGNRGPDFSAWAADCLRWTEGNLRPLKESYARRLHGRPATAASRSVSYQV